MIIILLAAATVVERLFGTAAARAWVYTSPMMIMLWGAVAVMGLMAVGRWGFALLRASGRASLRASGFALLRRRASVLSVMGIHAAFALILVGALTSHLTAHSGRLHLRVGEEASSVCCAAVASEASGKEASGKEATSASGKEATSASGKEASGDGSFELPFSLRLEAFDVVCYPGTQTPADFVSTLSIEPLRSEASGKPLSGRREASQARVMVSMNNVLTHRGYRFFQNAYDADRGGTTLLVSYDPYGTLITYVGYGLLFLSFLGYLLRGGSTRRGILYSSK